MILEIARKFEESVNKSWINYEQTVNLSSLSSLLSSLKALILLYLLQLLQLLQCFNILYRKNSVGNNKEFTVVIVVLSFLAN